MTVIAVSAEFSSRHGWLAIPLEIDGTFQLRMLISGFHTSIVSTNAVTAFPAFFQETAPGRYLMRRATIGEQAILDFEVRISRQIRRLGADGALGQDFLRRFTDINLNVPSSVLAFTGP